MNDKPILYVDQYGSKYHARTVRELREKLGGGRIAKMYRDTDDGGAVHVGYVVGRHWCTAYAPVRLPV